MVIFKRLSQLHHENSIQQGFQAPAVEINLNPYQGLKLVLVTQNSERIKGRNQLESLSGIETALAPFAPQQN